MCLCCGCVCDNSVQYSLLSSSSIDQFCRAIVLTLRLFVCCAICSRSYFVILHFYTSIYLFYFYLSISVSVFFFFYFFIILIIIQKWLILTPPFVPTLTHSSNTNYETSRFSFGSVCAALRIYLFKILYFIFI